MDYFYADDLCFLDLQMSNYHSHSKDLLSLERFLQIFKSVLQKKESHTHLRWHKALLKVKAVKAGVVAIRGHETELYLAMDKCGKLYGTAMLNEECYFIENIEENHYNTYRSQRYQENGDWYVGVKKNGRMKNGSKTHKGQNAIYFLPIPVDGSIQ
ncbi:fibroblast growth factor 1b isoform X2 [Myxocyprinus asiaticus]|uniref:fibroblast growth factor 1b isoform X2 n=1 Tax=Myxocyprinus asiaticus TaxID=70543 RepID=UPI0022238A4E|nr:fibroblast growth factor 1b isoform X2 [Myxocyprinus asiaticus]